MRQPPGHIVGFHAPGTLVPIPYIIEQQRRGQAGSAPDARLPEPPEAAVLSRLRRALSQLERVQAHVLDADTGAVLAADAIEQVAARLARAPVAAASKRPTPARVAHIEALVEAGKLARDEADGLISDGRVSDANWAVARRYQQT